MNRGRLACAALALLAGISQGHAETLKLLIWDSYVDPALVAQWKAETGIDVQEIIFDSGDKRDEILANPDSDIDIAVVSETGAARFGQKGILEPLADEVAPAVKTIEPRWRERCGHFGAPYFWGTLGIVYRADKVTPAPQSWNDLLAPSAAMAGHIAMVGDHNDILVPPLMLQGKSINAGDTSTLKAAFASLKDQARSVLTYDYVLTSVKDPAIGSSIYLALAYSGDQRALNQGLPAPGPWRYVLPKEGSLIWVDCLAVLAKSGRKQAALRFLDFLSQPAQAARNAQALAMPTPNAAALALLPEATRRDSEIFPNEAEVEHSQFYELPSAEAVQTRKRILSSLVNFHDAQ